MFGWRLIRIEKLRGQSELTAFFAKKCAKLYLELCEAKKENERLFDYHNKRLTKPRRDKRGVLRNPDGTFAKGGK